mmetsp:Transcript_29759/g.33837  ORF Transcript_29759/g.33837 Transcript_29759/m.33837 type:complete len:211 (-) Transcript_29759:196-828(-)
MDVRVELFVQGIVFLDSVFAENLHHNSTSHINPKVQLLQIIVILFFVFSNTLETTSKVISNFQKIFSKLRDSEILHVFHFSLHDLSGIFLISDSTAESSVILIGLFLFSSQSIFGLSDLFAQLFDLLLELSFLSLPGIIFHCSLILRIFRFLLAFFTFLTIFLSFLGLFGVFLSGFGLFFGDFGFRFGVLGGLLDGLVVEVEEVITRGVQ